MPIGAADARELVDGHSLVVGERGGGVGVGLVDHAVVGRHEHHVARREVLRQRHRLLAAAVDAAVDAARAAPVAAAGVVDAPAARVQLAAQTAAVAAAAALRVPRGRLAVRPAARTARAARTAGAARAGAAGAAAGRRRGRVGEQGELAMALMALDEDADEGDDGDGGERTPVENEIDEIHAVESVDRLMAPRCKLDTTHDHEKKLQSQQKEERECVDSGDPPR